MENLRKQKCPLCSQKIHKKCQSALHSWKKAAHTHFIEMVSSEVVLRSSHLTTPSVSVLRVGAFVICHSISACSSQDRRCSIFSKLKALLGQNYNINYWTSFTDQPLQFEVWIWDGRNWPTWISPISLLYTAYFAVVSCKSAWNADPTIFSRTFKNSQRVANITIKTQLQCNPENTNFGKSNFENFPASQSASNTS